MLPNQREVNKTPKHILVIRLSAMGDVAMSVPVLWALTQQYPSVKITVLSRGFFKPIFNGIPNVNFYAADVKNKHKGILGLYRLYKELKALQIDAIADIHNVLRSKILCTFFSFSGIKKAVIDKGRAEKKALTRTHNKVFKQLKTTHERYADVFRKLGFSIDLTKVHLSGKADLLPNVQQIVPQNHLKWIGVAPFAQHQPKMYPLDMMEQVIQQLAESGLYTIFLFGGGPNETRQLKEIASMYTNTINVSGMLSFQEEINLISNLDLMISMDSANGHLAAMQQVKTLTLWGATHPFAGFTPYNQPVENQLIPDLKKYPNLPCSIYGNKTCEGYEDAMQSIPVEEVVLKVKSP